MNFEIFVLGTSGMMPLPGRFLTSALLRREGELFLFDCGEGTQVTLKMLNLKWKKINSIFISHMHADHVTGLPGILMLSSQVERDTPLYIYGPRKLKEYIEANRRILDMYINYEIIVIPVEPGRIFETDEYFVEAFELNHTKPCLGYSFIEKERPGEFNPEAAATLGIPRGPLWGQLQKGNTVTLEDGREIHPDAVMGLPRGGRKFSYVTDSLYFPAIAEHVKDADFFLCEGMFENALEASAVEKKHMTAVQAARIAHDAHVKKMGLFHYSPRYTDKEIKKLVEEARAVFPRTIHTRDRMCFTIPLPQD
ncbi:ribonuclease Z [Parasphaerochaeta coccoides]|uniref:Ribonuclease Z n=1 Tax=Parasphaerochaeta coccoides (strain ATCC BAA-1237 / DSM 17374 / SPN1) TaxID=760011 RepID=F4GJD1_PARC1|nr:ribonuclease Z [Parasphaerochaeta coccoides]AEC01771.1 RNAse Z [Parasphaerochaeta coccoides DSM 17374]